MGNGGSKKEDQFDITAAPDILKNTLRLLTRTPQQTTPKETPTRYIYLFIRHGFSCANYVKQTSMPGIGSMTQGLRFPASPLTTTGIRQAREVGQQIIKAIHLDDELNGQYQLSREFYSSNLPRAMETAYYLQQGTAAAVLDARSAGGAVARFGRGEIVPIDGVKESGNTGENKPMDIEEYKKYYPQFNEIVSRIRDNDVKNNFGVTKPILQAGGDGQKPVKGNILLGTDHRVAFFKALAAEMKAVAKRRRRQRQKDGEPPEGGDNKIVVVPIVSHGSTLTKHLLSESLFPDAKLGNVGIIAVATDAVGNIIPNTVTHKKATLVFSGFSKKTGANDYKKTGGWKSKICPRIADSDGEDGCEGTAATPRPATRITTCDYGKDRNWSSLGKRAASFNNRRRRKSRRRKSRRRKSHRRKSRRRKSRRRKSHRRKSHRRKSRRRKSHRRKSRI